MPQFLFTLCFVLAWMTQAAAQETKFTVKIVEAAPPKELSEKVREVLASSSLTVFDGSGKVFCTIWPVKQLHVEAKAEQVASGLKYSDLEETTLIGVVKFPETWIDYRKQKIKPGIYTLRYAIQLMDGDHMGTAPYNDFCLLSQVADDTKAGTMTVEELFELSTKASPRKHPAIMLMFPNRMPAAAPVIETKAKDHTVVSFRLPAVAGEQKTHLGLSLVIVGVTTAE